MGLLKGKSIDCDFNLQTGETCYMDKIIMHTLVQELVDSTITKDVMEEYTNRTTIKAA